MTTNLANISPASPDLLEGSTEMHNDKLWKIVKKQRQLILELQKALTEMTQERDHLLSILGNTNTSMTGLVSPEHRSLTDDSLSSSSSSGSSSIGRTTVMPPPRSPHRKAERIIPPANAIVDNDAQLFAKYQCSVSPVDDAMLPPQLPPSKTTTSVSSSEKAAPVPRPTTSTHTGTRGTRKHQIRRASSQPAISPSGIPVKVSLSDSLTAVSVHVLGSNMRTNSKGKNVVSFTISVKKRSADLWCIEKLYSDFLALDAQLKQHNNRAVRTSSKACKLPDKTLFATHAPSKAEQRKIAIEKYLQHVIDVPWKDPTPLRTFLDSNKVENTTSQSISGRKQGYLATKRGKSFGGWKSRYFVLHGSQLRYYESRGGALLGTIHLAGSQVIRQHTHSSAQSQTDTRHAFLILEPKRGSATDVHRHVLCADTDDERDSWVEVLSRHISSDRSKTAPAAAPKPSPSKSSRSTASKQAASERKVSKEDIRPIAAVPMTESHHMQNAKLAHNRQPYRSNSDTSLHPSDATFSSRLDRKPLRSSLDQAMFGQSNQAQSHKSGVLSEPTSPTEESSRFVLGNRSPSTPDDKKKRSSRKTFWARKIFASSDATSGMSSTQGLRGFLSRNSNDANADVSFAYPPPPPPPSHHRTTTPDTSSKVFGVPLEQAIQSSRISDKHELPAVVYRCIEYLEAKQATQEEGIYRLSGSAVKIRALKEEFDQGADVNLLESGVYHDTHAVAGLLKLWLRELPGSVLTQELLGEFLPVIDLADRDERIKELGRLVSMLPLANYTLLRILCAHLIRVVQYAETNKMTIRNVGIIFSPTLQIPAGIFSLFLSEFDYIFWTNTGTAPPSPPEETVDMPVEAEEPIHPTQQCLQVPVSLATRSNRNSVHFMDTVPMEMVGLEKGNAVVQGDDDSLDDIDLSAVDGEDESATTPTTTTPIT
ncbi:hypothetical protein BCR43DRAFT_455175 [Syncephalastrum racemosum]|uniref:RhoGAP-domain-containing protein n=1 Tax=Syncephalastrum racemosum TaxID=13706 RepID=A0A1X2HIK5_SYNRA|nr:hypothetical protein BCR43DRAFT_455175 [Syncephalastrum racemosum]